MTIGKEKVIRNQNQHLTNAEKAKARGCELRGHDAIKWLLVGEVANRPVRSVNAILGSCQKYY